MARLKRLQLPEEDRPGLDISSLIDVCFLLLIYFLVTTQIVRKEQELSSNIPSHIFSESPVTLAPLVIVLAANGQVSIRGENRFVELIESDVDSRQLPHLSKRLSLHKSVADLSSQKALVQIQAHGNAVQQRVIDILNAVAGAEITDITFVDSPDEGKL